LRGRCGLPAEAGCASGFSRGVESLICRNEAWQPIYNPPLFY
jgi:hypothetical protein